MIFEYLDELYSPIIILSRLFLGDRNVEGEKLEIDYLPVSYSAHLVAQQPIIQGYLVIHQERCQLDKVL